MSEVLDADARSVDRVIEVGAHLAQDFHLSVSSFLFLRHGRTSANHLGIIQGQKDVPLDEVGRAQAQTAAERLRRGGIRPRRIIASDLSRAAETARILASGLAMKVEAYDPGLRERHFGEMQGSRSRQLLWHSDPPGAESIEEFVSRCAGTLQRHLTEPGTLLVAHGGVLRATAALLQRPLAEGASANAVPLSFERDERGWEIRLMSNEPVIEGQL